MNDVADDKYVVKNFFRKLFLRFYYYYMFLTWYMYLFYCISSGGEIEILL